MFKIKFIDLLFITLIGCAMLWLNVRTENNGIEYVYLFVGLLVGTGSGFVIASKW